LVAAVARFDSVIGIRHTAVTSSETIFKMRFIWLPPQKLPSTKIRFNLGVFETETREQRRWRGDQR
jgi:hypothetical protein